MLSLIDELLILAAYKKHQSDKFSKKLCFKDHLTTMLYCIFARCSSIREVQAGLELCNGKLNHLNLKMYRKEARLVMAIRKGIVRYLEHYTKAYLTPQLHIRVYF